MHKGDAVADIVDRFDESLQAVATNSPLLKTVTPADVGNAAVFYAAEMSNMITGSTVDVDSGMNVLVSSAGLHPRAGESQPNEPETPAS